MTSVSPTFLSLSLPLTAHQHGAGFPAVNGASSLDLFDANIPISITPVLTGLQYGNTYASEFGCSVYRRVSLGVCAPLRRGGPVSCECVERLVWSSILTLTWLQLFQRPCSACSPSNFNLTSPSARLSRCRPPSRLSTGASTAGLRRTTVGATLTVSAPAATLWPSGTSLCVCVCVC
jgi:hypothetical protein